LVRPLVAAVLLTLTPGAVRAADAPAAGAADWARVRRARIQQLLPQAMARANVDAWVVVCRENDNDPLAAHVGGENAGGTMAVLFLRQGDTVRSLALSPEGEAQALQDVGAHDEVERLPRGTDLYARVAARLAKVPGRIAVNASESVTVADGLSSTQRASLERALSPALRKRLVSSGDLVSEWLSVKLPEEVEVLRQAAALTAKLEEEAYRQVVPGKTRDSDVARYLKRRMAELGVQDAWQPDQNPNVNSGPDRGHSHATDRVIQPGDFIQTDFGVMVHGRWVTDIQRFAYVLAPGETRAPPEALARWEKAKRGSRIALAALKPGVRGWDVDNAQRTWMREAGSEPVMWGTGHPVGYWAHDAGPALSGAQRGQPAKGASARVVRPGQVFAFDGFFAWKLPTPGETKTLSVEEMAVVTPTGAEYLIPPQEELILIPSPAKAASPAR
jgi:Xaa-Pro dipeptidase